MSRIYAQQKRPVVTPANLTRESSALHSPSLVSGGSSSQLDAMMLQKFQQHFADNQIPTAEAEADRIAASVTGARTPEEVKSQLGEKMGADFSGVTFHTDSASRGVADTMGARAYTSGSDVYFGTGGFDPGIAAHELVHTVQQGVVGSSMQTTSAPTGGVQMKQTHLFKGIGRSIASLFKESDEKKRQRADAEYILNRIVKSSPNHVKEQDDLEQKHQELFRRFENFDGDESKMYVPNPMNETEFLLMPEVRRRYHAAQEELDNPVNIEGLNGKSMLKNARALERMAGDFRGMDVRSIKKKSKSKETDEMAGILDASNDTREIRIDDPFYTNLYGGYAPARVWLPIFRPPASALPTKTIPLPMRQVI